MQAIYCVAACVHIHLDIFVIARFLSVRSGHAVGVRKEIQKTTNRPLVLRTFDIIAFCNIFYFVYHSDKICTKPQRRRERLCSRTYGPHHQTSRVRMEACAVFVSRPCLVV